MLIKVDKLKTSKSKIFKNYFNKRIVYQIFKKWKCSIKITVNPKHLFNEERLCQEVLLILIKTDKLHFYYQIVIQLYFTVGCIHFLRVRNILLLIKNVIVINKH